MSCKAYETKQVTINGQNYLILAFNASVGLSLMKDIATVMSKFGKGITTLLSQFVTSGVSSISKIPLEPVLQEFLGNLECVLVDEALLPLVKRLIANCQIEGKSLNDDSNFNLVFSRNYEDLFALIKEVIVFNFFSQSFTKNLMQKTMEKTAQIQSESDK